MPRTGIMLAYPFEEKRLARWKPPYVLQPKLDGERCRSLNTLLFPNGPEQPSRSMLVSSEENPFFSVPHINQAIVDLGLNNLELDGELYSHDLHKEGGFELIHSIVSRTVNLHPRYEEMEYHIFDVVDEREIQSSRLVKLADLSHEFRPPLRYVPVKVCLNFDQVMKGYEKFIEAGYEGMIVRHAAASYVRRRSTFMMKFKPKRSDTYDIVGSVEEVSITGVPKGALGALILRGSDGTEFKVGTGFTREHRESLWERVGLLNGKRAKVSYQHLTTGKKVPRFPVFVEIVDE